MIPVFMNCLYILAKLGYNEMDTQILEDEELSPVFFNKLTENYKQDNIQQLNGLFTNLLQIMGTPQGVLGVLNVGDVCDKLADWYDIDKSVLKDEGEREQFIEGYINSLMQGGQE